MELNTPNANPFQIERKKMFPMTYSMVLAVAAAAAANLLAAQEKNGSAETFSHINATARADLEESRIL